MKYVIILFLLICKLGFAQEYKGTKWIFGPSLAYEYQEKNFLKASLWALTDLGYANYLRFDGTADLTYHDKKAIVVPELGITYYLSAKGIWPFIKAEITPNTFTPKLGIGLFNILEIGAGYGMPLKSHSKLPPIRGVAFQVGVSIPLNYYLD